MRLQTKLSHKPLGKYFTRDAISDLLVSYLSVKDPKIVLDLGSGDGSLSKAAARRWNNAKFITVDIDNDTCIDELLISQPTYKHLHYKLDALEPTLISDIGITPEVIDIALCNPPFIKAKWKDRYLSLLHSVGINDILCGVENITAEVIFVIQNLLSLRKGGQLGLIVPDGFISGEKNKKFRDFILESNSIDRVIKLPKNSFVGTNIQAHIVIITKGAHNDSVQITDITNNDGQIITDTITINKHQAIDSLDYDYHKHSLEKNINWATLSDIGCKVSRGRYNSKQCKLSTVPIYHTIDFPCDVKYITFSSNPIKTNYRNDTIAREGDILLARVGRNLTSKIALVKKGSSLISDCIFRLEVPYHYREKVFNFLVSETGREQLSKRAHGTGASYLTTAMLLQLPVIGITKVENNG